MRVFVCVCVCALVCMRQCVCSNVCVPVCVRSCVCVCLHERIRRVCVRLSRVSECVCSSVFVCVCVSAVPAPDGVRQRQQDLPLQQPSCYAGDMINTISGLLRECCAYAV